MPHSKTNVQYDLRLPGEVYCHFRLRATAEEQKLSALIRGIIKREYNLRLSGEKRGDVDIVNSPAGPKHQVTMSLLVHQYYKDMANRLGVDLSVILRSIIITQYQEETGLMVEGKNRVNKPALDEDTGIEEKRKRGRPRKVKKE